MSCPWEAAAAGAQDGCLYGALAVTEPPDPPEGSFVIWMSPTADNEGNAGNVLLKATYRGKTRTAVIVNFSAVGS